ncbi:MAG: shikimate dehydrogenase [Chitinophagaceae bacterium]|nr:shikimate dehydrogenase [Chitinophagaceae bacterium]
MRRFGLIGYPLGHSFSKKYFTEKFEKEGIADCIFELFPIESIDEFPSLIKQYPDLKGLSVTIPYKQSVYKYLDQINIPKGINACNSIKIDNGKLSGYNTDYIGFKKSFIELLQPHHKKALVLGNGGATEAVVYVLNQLNIGYKIVSRQLHGASSLTYADIDKELIESHQVIINSTPLGTYPSVDACPDIPYEYLTPDHYLFDLVYNPPKTLFLQRGEAKGALVKNGYDMLSIQAEESWKIWNG